METMLISLSLLTTLLLGVLIALLIMLNRTLGGVTEALQETNRSLRPLLEDLSAGTRTVKLGLDIARTVAGPLLDKFKFLQIFRRP